MHASSADSDGARGCRCGRARARREERKEAKAQRTNDRKTQAEARGGVGRRRWEVGGEDNGRNGVPRPEL